MVTVGNGKSGSWKMRGEQLGRAIGAQPMPGLRDPTGLDRLIVVKRPDYDLVHCAKRLRVPVVYDVVDAWQGQINDGRRVALQWLRERMRLVQPDGIVAATQAMADDCMEFGVPVVAIPHHARPGQELNPIRQEIKTVGYEGSARYFEKWRPIVEQECKLRGWSFVMNPASLAELDIVLALRDETNYAARHWKSNVKLANAQATGTPIVLNRERGYLETASGGERFADDLVELRSAFDSLVPYGARVEASFQLRSARVDLPGIAQRYREWLCSSKF